MPLVSVIMNVRNGAATLAEALDSVLAQSLGDWDIILWDDQSTDASATIAANYRDPRIHYFRSPELTTLGKARNAAMEQANGRWLAFLDQDDLWLPRKLELQMNLADESTGLIYGRTVRFYPNGRQRDYDQAHEYKLLPEGNIFEQLFTNGCFIAMSSAVFRKDAVQAIGGIPSEIQIIPDYYLYTAVSKSYRAKAVQETVCRYRMHPYNMSGSVTLEMHREALWLVEHWKDSLDPHVFARALQRHNTAIAVEEFKTPSSMPAGLARLLRHGSPGSQLARPALFVFHLLRRNVLLPHWKTLKEESLAQARSSASESNHESQPVHSNRQH